MKRHSIRLRLFAGAATLIVLASLTAGLAIGWMFDQTIERVQHKELVANLNRLVAQMDVFAATLLPENPLGDPRFATPLGGAYWQVEERDTELSWRSRSLWDEVLALPEIAGGSTEQHASIAGPLGEPLGAVFREVRFAVDGERIRRFVVLVAENRQNIDETTRAFTLQLALTLVLFSIAIIAASWGLIALGLRPLRQLQGGLTAMQRGEVTALSDAVPVEVEPLVREVNTLLETRTRSLDTMRSRAADLAARVSGPLGTLRLLGGRLRRNGSPEAGEGVERAAGEIEAQIAFQSRLAGLRLRLRQRTLSAALSEAVDRGIAELGRSADLDTTGWRIVLPPGLVLDIDRHDLAELIGALLREGQRRGGVLALSAEALEGMAELRLEMAGAPGAGESLDMALAAEIVALNGGTLVAETGSEGGGLLRVQLPLSRPGAG